MKRFTDTTVGFAPVRDFMTRLGPSLPFATPLRTAASRLLHGEADAILVHHDDGALAGLLTERELVFGAQAVAEGHPDRAGAYVSTDYVHASETERIAEVLARMAEWSVPRALVLDRAGEVSGLLSLWTTPRAQRDADLSQEATAAAEA